MEWLDNLERQVHSLIMKIDSLNEENAILRAEISSGFETLKAENAGLKHALEEEQKLKNTVAKRVDGLLSHIRDAIKDEQ
jgi:regulator of replication initiation timing